MPEFLNSIEEAIKTWHGIEAPNDPAKRMAADLASMIAAFEKLRGDLRFEEEPAIFERVLLEMREQG